MAHKRNPAPRNPLKEQSESKRTVQEHADHAAAGPSRAAPAGGADVQRRQESREHADQGATSRDAAVGPWAAGRQNNEAAQQTASRATDSHPGQHGGARAADHDTDPRADNTSGVKRGPSPADEPSSDRTGTAPHRGAASGRTGRTGEDRHRPRDGSD